MLYSSLLELSTNYQRCLFAFFTPTAAEVPATCLGAALMPIVQALSCVLRKHLQSDPLVSHQRSTKGASNDHWSNFHRNDMLNDSRDGFGTRVSYWFPNLEMMAFAKHHLAMTPLESHPTLEDTRPGEVTKSNGK